MGIKKRDRREKKLLFEGGLHPCLEKLFDGLTLNILWLLCCVPVITIGASTAAFYYTTTKVLRGERGHILPEFWRSFRLNFVKAVVLFLIFAVLLFIIAINMRIAPEIDRGYFGIFLICLYFALGAVIFAFMIYAFPALSRFEMNAFWILKLSVYMTFRYFHYTLALLGIYAAAGIIIYYIPFFIIFVPSLALLAASHLLERLLIRHTPAP
ncbi:MAG: DUF624 domain-containing protein, partial [Treponema sp.]|nr:DUF624 domain-containing protein [Treponema sp.]